MFSRIFWIFWSFKWCSNAFNRFEQSKISSPKMFGKFENAFTRLKITEKTSEVAKNEYFLFLFLSCLFNDLYTKNFWRLEFGLLPCVTAWDLWFLLLLKILLLLSVGVLHVLFFVFSYWKNKQKISFRFAPAEKIFRQYWRNSKIPRHDEMLKQNEKSNTKCEKALMKIDCL